MITWNGDAFHNEIRMRIDAQAHDLGKKVVQKAEQFAPKRTGKLATSISYTYNPTSHEISFNVGAPYGLFVEFGTRYMRPRPYLRPALNAVGEIFGFETEMAFQNVIQTDRQLVARGPYFEVGKKITPAQRKHIKTFLKPTSEGYFKGGKSNVGRAKLKVRHKF